MSAPTLQSGSADRIGWIDYSKGICIIAVVCLYTTQYLQDTSQSGGWMQHWVEFAKPFRMPDFFLMAGLFLSRSINKPWREYLDKKVFHFVYFFALWTTAYFAMHVLRAEPGEAVNPGLEYLSWYVEPFHMLWFIEMLAVFFLVTKLLKDVPWYLVLGGAAVLQIISIDTHYGQATRFCARYVYFYAGFIFAPLFFQFAAWVERRPRVAVGLLVVWAVVNEALVLGGLAHKPGIGLMLGFAGALAVIAGGSLLGRARRGTQWLKHLGQNSIVVFLSFFVFIVVAAKFFERYPLIESLSWRQAVATFIGVLGPVLLFRLIRKTPGRFLFRRPSWTHIPYGPALPAPDAPKRALGTAAAAMNPPSATPDSAGAGVALTPPVGPSSSHPAPTYAPPT
jgi:uncharacterized membrane protein YcfT